jgi:hypothetical protein
MPSCSVGREWQRERHDYGRSRVQARDTGQLERNAEEPAPEAITEIERDVKRGGCSAGRFW